MPPKTNDLQFLDQLRSYYAQHKAFPSYQRLATHLGFASRSAIKKLLERLRQQRFIERNAHTKWIPGARFFERALSQTPVVAGMPSLADDLAEEPLAIDQWFVRNPATTVLVPVTGDSMIDAGIYEGDVAVVEKQTSAEPGQLVIALVDGEWTLKTLGTEEGQPILLPANAAYSPIRPQSSLQICGVVVGLMRRYGR